MTDVEVTEKETLLLEVEVYAVPEPKIVWFKDGQEVRSDARIKIQRDSQRLESYNLTLNLIKREEAGVYEMKASNTLGTAVSKSVVTVNSKYNQIISNVLSTLNERKNKNNVSFFCLNVVILIFINFFLSHLNSILFVGG